MKKIHFIVILSLFLSSCGGAATPPRVTEAITVIPTAELTLPTPSTIFSTLPPNPTATLDTRLPPEDWQEWPVIPAVTGRAIEIYRAGLALGNNPHAYSKIGDSETVTDRFLVPFDGDPRNYSLGKYTSLQFVVDYFHGSHGRISIASGIGFNTGSILTPLWSNRKLCEINETPLACEIRIHRPAYALILLGTNDVPHQETFEANMRSILDDLIEKGVVPILATKADNLEGNYSINATIVRLAYEYDIPLWNFWLAVQPLPSHGLEMGLAHLTWARPFFDDPVRMEMAGPWRNLTALQALDAVSRGVGAQP